MRFVDLTTAHPGPRFGRHVKARVEGDLLVAIGGCQGPRPIALHELDGYAPLGYAPGGSPREPAGSKSAQEE